jgi:hypothetical protein
MLQLAVLQTKFISVPDDGHIGSKHVEVFNVLIFEWIYTLLLNDMTAVGKGGKLNTNNMNHGGTLVI